MNPGHVGRQRRWVAFVWVAFLWVAAITVAFAIIATAKYRRTVVK